MFTNGKWNDLNDNAAGLTGGFIAEYAPIPEPSVFALVAIGAAALLALRRRSCQPRLHALVIASLLHCPTAKANLLENGGFEQPDVSANWDFIGPFAFTGWTGFSTGLDLATGNAGIVDGIDFGLSPFEGNQAFSFNGDNPAPGTWVEQSFSTLAGLPYLVSFAVGRNNGFPEQVLNMQSEVFSATDVLLSQLAWTPPSTVGYGERSFVFIATTSFSRLRFTDTSLSNPNTDLVLDAVAVNVIPEPSTLALAVLGAALMLTRRRK
jgi:hypothetical protein